MDQVDRDIYAEARRVHEDLFKKLLALKQLRSKKQDLGEFVDSIHALKMSEKALEDICKEIRAAVTIIERMTCLLWVAKGEFDPIRTKHGTGSPNVRVTVQTPKRGTEEYTAFLKHFGIPEDSPFRPHWPTLMDRITADQKLGRPLPPGCDPGKQTNEYRVTITHRKPIDGGKVSDPALLRKQYALLDRLSKMDIKDVYENAKSLVKEFVEIIEAQEELDDEKTEAQATFEDEVRSEEESMF